MARRRRSAGPEALLVFIIAPLVVLLFGSIIVDANFEKFFWLLLFIALIVAIIAIPFVAHYYLTSRKRARDLVLLGKAKVDEMTGAEFEIFLANLLTARGFKVKDIKHSRDGGVDIVAAKNKDRYSIQAKRYGKNKVGRQAITDAVAGMRFRDCNKSMAITNSYFTSSAIEYAEKTDCELIDRDELASWIAEV